MSDTDHSPDPFDDAMRDTALGKAQEELGGLRRQWTENGISPLPVPFVEPESDAAFRKPEWIGGWDAFEIFSLQTEPGDSSRAIARICQTIADQEDRESNGLNYAFNRLPPNHELLKDFALGSNQWFDALHRLLTLRGADGMDGWESLEANLYDWIGPEDSLRIRGADVVDNALRVDWAVSRYSLPEAKQNPVWAFPQTMTWIATRDYLALANMGLFRRPIDPEEAICTDGVCSYNTKALGWLHTLLAYADCKCGALEAHGWDALRHCTCVSKAWEELVHFNGGLTSKTPELVFGLDGGCLSMTWPDGADELRFLRRDILEKWPALPLENVAASGASQSTGKAESECKDWLLKAFESDPKKRRSKEDFRDHALKVFAGRLSKTGFNQRVWPELAERFGRSQPGAKKKS